MLVFTRSIQYYCQYLLIFLLKQNLTESRFSSIPHPVNTNRQYMYTQSILILDRVMSSYHDHPDGEKKLKMKFHIVNHIITKIENSVLIFIFPFEKDFLFTPKLEIKSI